MAALFGRGLRGLWSLADDATFLNHGSYGACPIVVQDEQRRLRDEMESAPDRLFGSIVPRNHETPLRAVARRLAPLTGVSGDSLAFVENASTGIEAVLQSVAFAPGDEILITDHQYNAVRLAADERCKHTGATVRIVAIPIPTDAGSVRARIRAAASPNVKLAIIDHITSASALVFPVADIIADLHALGIPVLVDGAHTIGQIPLDIAALGAEWYVSNAHKWLFSARGTAFLHASEAVAPITRPTVTSHYVDFGFPKSFDYIGTRDYTPWLALPAAIAFFEELDPVALREHQRALVAFGSEQLIALGAEPAGPLDMCAAMRSFVLPQRRATQFSDAHELTSTLWNEERIGLMVTVAFDALIVRFSTQAYVEESDLTRLRSALERHGWPGR